MINLFILFFCTINNSIAIPRLRIRRFIDNANIQIVQNFNDCENSLSTSSNFKNPSDTKLNNVSKYANADDEISNITTSNNKKNNLQEDEIDNIFYSNKSMNIMMYDSIDDEIFLKNKVNNIPEYDTSNIDINDTVNSVMQRHISLKNNLNIYGDGSDTVIPVHVTNTTGHFHSSTSSSFSSTETVTYKTLQLSSTSKYTKPSFGLSQHANKVKQRQLSSSSSSSSSQRQSRSQGLSMTASATTSDDNSRAISSTNNDFFTTTTTSTGASTTAATSSSNTNTMSYSATSNAVVKKSVISTKDRPMVLARLVSWILSHVIKAFTNRAKGLKVFVDATSNQDLLRGRINNIELQFDTIQWGELFISGGGRITLEGVNLRVRRFLFQNRPSVRTPYKLYGDLLLTQEDILKSKFIRDLTQLLINTILSNALSPTQRLLSVSVKSVFIKERRIYATGDVLPAGGGLPFGFEVSLGAGVRDEGQIIYVKDIQVVINPDSAIVRTTIPIPLVAPIDVDLGNDCRIESLIISNKYIWIHFNTTISPIEPFRVAQIEKKAMYHYDLAALLSSFMKLPGGFAVKGLSALMFLIGISWW